MGDSHSRRRGILVVFTLAVLAGACGTELPPAPQVRADLRDGVTPAESLAILSQGDTTTASPSAAPTSTQATETCTIAWSAPDTVTGCSVPVPTVNPTVPWLQHSGKAVDPGEIEYRGPISIRFGVPVKGLTLTSTGALSCTGTFGTLIGYRHDSVVASADNVLTDPADCGSDSVTFGVTGQFPPDRVIDSLVIGGVNPWTFPVGNLTGRALLKYTLTYEPQSAGSTSVVIQSVQTANNGSFTTLATEDTITLTAVTMPASLADSVRWSVTDFTGDQVPSIPPDSASLGRGATIRWEVPKQDSVRWHAFKHPGSLDQKSLAYLIVASVTDATGATVHSKPDTVKQDEIDTMREEYVELRVTFLPVPARSDFSAEPHCDAPCLNTGDYGQAIVKPTFSGKLQSLRTHWENPGKQWQRNSLYRNPVHQIIHLTEEIGKQQSRTSRHMFGCAADLQTFPAGLSKSTATATDSLHAKDFWKGLKMVADSAHYFWVEPMKMSGIGHVHVQTATGCS